MTVAPPSLSIFGTPVRTAAKAGAEKGHPRLSFADAVSAVEMSAERTALELNAAAGVGDAAVSFDARPLVGPVAIPPAGGETSAPAELPMAEAKTTAGEAGMATTAPCAKNGSEALRVGQSEREALSESGKRTVVTDLRPSPAAPRHLTAGDAVSPAAARVGPPPAHRDGPSGLGGLSLRTAPASVAPRLPAIASLTITPHEVRVTVHDVELSDAEQARLKEWVRDLVARSHAGERAVRIVSSSRSA